jgi:hypothetical protein
MTTGVRAVNSFLLLCSAAAPRRCVRPCHTLHSRHRRAGPLPRPHTTCMGCPCAIARVRGRQGADVWGDFRVWPVCGPSSVGEATSRGSIGVYSGSTPTARPHSRATSCGVSRSARTARCYAAGCHLNRVWTMPQTLHPATATTMSTRTPAHPAALPRKKHAATAAAACNTHAHTYTHTPVLLKAVTR